LLFSLIRHGRHYALISILKYTDILSCNNTG
jgi:hypothetical protein